jgi:hypothetical protein
VSELQNRPETPHPDHYPGLAERSCRLGSETTAPGSADASRSGGSSVAGLLLRAWKSGGRRAVHDLLPVPAVFGAFLWRQPGFGSRSRRPGLPRLPRPALFECSSPPPRRPHPAGDGFRSNCRLPHRRERAGKYSRVFLREPSPASSRRTSQTGAANILGFASPIRRSTASSGQPRTTGTRGRCRITRLPSRFRPRLRIGVPSPLSPSTPSAPRTPSAPTKRH